MSHLAPDDGGWLFLFGDYLPLLKDENLIHNREKTNLTKNVVIFQHSGDRVS
jgi:hypothetical protein